MDKPTDINTNTIEELQGELWQLEYHLTKILEKYRCFYMNMTWSKYGEVILLENTIASVIRLLKDLLNKIETGEKGEKV